MTIHAVRISKTIIIFTIASTTTAERCLVFCTINTQPHCHCVDILDSCRPAHALSTLCDGGGLIRTTSVLGYMFASSAESKRLHSKSGRSVQKSIRISLNPSQTHAADHVHVFPQEHDKTRLRTYNCCSLTLQCDLLPASLRVPCIKNFVEVEVGSVTMLSTAIACSDTSKSYLDATDLVARGSRNYQLWPSFQENTTWRVL